MNPKPFKSKLLNTLLADWMARFSEDESEKMEYIDNQVKKIEDDNNSLRLENKHLKIINETFKEENIKLKESLDRFENPN